MQHQPSMKQIMATMAEKNAAIQERTLALSGKKAALAERDVAILLRGSAIVESYNAMIERDKAIATLQYQESAMNGGNVSQCSSGCQISHGMKHIPHLQQHSYMSEALFDTKDTHVNDTIPLSAIAPKLAKSHGTKHAKKVKVVTSTRTTTKSSKKVKRESEDIDRTLFKKSQRESGSDVGFSSDELNRPLGGEKPNWKDHDLGLNHVAFDKLTMLVPVCSYIRAFRSCYKWGNGGWQSSCCTTNLSMYPLPAMPNKRHARINGRKMCGSVFNKLLSRLTTEDHDLSNPVDLKDHWAKHGTSRYITIK